MFLPVNITGSFEFYLCLWTACESSQILLVLGCLLILIHSSFFFFFPQLLLAYSKSELGSMRKLERHIIEKDVTMLFFSIFRLDILICISKSCHAIVAVIVIWFQTEILFHSNCVFVGKEMAFCTTTSQQKTVFHVDFLNCKTVLSLSWFYTSFVRLNQSQLWQCFVDLRA